MRDLPVATFMFINQDCVTNRQNHHDRSTVLSMNPHSLPYIKNQIKKALRDECVFFPIIEQMMVKSVN